MELFGKPYTEVVCFRSDAKACTANSFSFSREISRFAALADLPSPARRHRPEMFHSKSLSLSLYKQPYTPLMLLHQIFPFPFFFFLFVLPPTSFKGLVARAETIHPQKVLFTPFRRLLGRICASFVSTDRCELEVLDSHTNPNNLQVSRPNFISVLHASSWLPLNGSLWFHKEAETFD